MAEPLFEVLSPYLENSPQDGAPHLQDNATRNYLNRLLTLQLSAVCTTEQQSLSQSAHSTLLSIQALSTRSSKNVVKSADQLRGLHTSIAGLRKDVKSLQTEIKGLDGGVVEFAQKYNRSVESQLLERRKKALLVSRNVDRLTDILDLPTLLASAINSATLHGSSNTNYAAALDLQSHIKGLHQAIPHSSLLRTINSQAERSIRNMKSNLISSLQAQNIKLAAGMRTIGWLRRIAPELDAKPERSSISTTEGGYGALFLICRLCNLLTMLDALEPLKQLADQESQARQLERGSLMTGSAWSSGQQTERYLKRYIEIFREQSFAIISMFRNVFSHNDAGTNDSIPLQFKSLGLKSPMPTGMSGGSDNDTLQPVPSALATFPLHLVDLLSGTLQEYLPNVRDKLTRESLLTQVLYCAGSLGRLGGDFSMIIALLQDTGDNDDYNEAHGVNGDQEWVAIMKKHRALAGRLETLAGGTGGSAKAVTKGS